MVILAKQSVVRHSIAEDRRQPCRRHDIRCFCVSIWAICIRPADLLSSELGPKKVFGLLKLVPFVESVAVSGGQQVIQVDLYLLLEDNGKIEQVAVVHRSCTIAKRSCSSFSIRI